MNEVLHSNNLNLEPLDNRQLANLCGYCNEHLHLIEQQLNVTINHRGNVFQVKGEPHAVKTARNVLHSLHENITQGDALTLEKINLMLREKIAHQFEPKTASAQFVNIKTRKLVIKTRTPAQQDYLKNIQKYDINFAVGPAGTGKTYLAVASALAALEQEKVERLILVRPAVEAGERLGFLPGDLAQKVDPYLRPIYDALYEMAGPEHVAKLMERNVIEIAPLAYMRGRTLNNAFVILDEGQNTTVEQMKMFLTRIGFGSHAIITGDITQVDLGSHTVSGLINAEKILTHVEGISFNYFSSKDVVRHSLVQKIIEAYQKELK